VLRRIAEATKADQGGGAVPAVITAALKRIIGFEIQFGPFAVAQLRLLAEIADLLNAKTTLPAGARLRLYVTNTLGNPDEENEYIPQILKPLADSRRQANAIKRAEPITVVIGNPPYKEKAMGKGGWIEAGSVNTNAPLDRWIPPPQWGISAHAKHLRNLCLFLALGYVESVRRYCVCAASRPGPQRHRVLRYSSRVSQWTRLPEDAR
jgi:hypothetical protein